MADVIGDLRQALAEFDGCTPAERGFRVRSALRVLTLVRRLLVEVDGERAGVCTCLPLVTCDNCERAALRDDDYTSEAMDRVSFGAEPLGGLVPGAHGSHLPG